MRNRLDPACFTRAASSILLAQYAEAALHLVEAAPFCRPKPLSPGSHNKQQQPCNQSNPDGALMQISALSYHNCVGLASCALARACSERAVSMQGGPAQGIHQAAP